jgi:hypothetical protein
VEVLVGLLLGSLLVTLAMATLARQRKVQASLSQQADLLATIRTARYVLGREVRSLRGGGERVSVARDSLELRLFRGQGIVCPDRPGPGSLWVSAEGVRSPHVAEDSVLVYGGLGLPVARALAGRDPAPGGCGIRPDLRWERWTLAEPLPGDALFVRYFQRSSYHLSDGALRYRAGGAGRQPLTPAALDGSASGFWPASGGVTVRLVPAAGNRSPWLLFLPLEDPVG